MNNPLLTNNLLPRFDHVRPEHMETAIDQILSENRVKIASLAQNEDPTWDTRSEEHTSELQSRPHIVCRLLLEKKKKNKQNTPETKKKKHTITHNTTNRQQLITTHNTL